MINVSPLVDTIVNFVKPFLKEKIRERIHLHSSMDSLYKFVPKDMLPVEYGGQSGNIKDLNGKANEFYHIFIKLEQHYSPEQWRQKLKDYTPWFKEQEASKADESLRPGGSRSADDLFGMDGTFRKLTID